eukprot:48416-Pleurochrysis_carterae.AAC.2
MGSHRLTSDVDLSEEAELRRLEAGEAPSSHEADVRQAVGAATSGSSGTAGGRASGRGAGESGRQPGPQASKLSDACRRQLATDPAL